MLTITLLPRSCPICGHSNSARLFCDSNFQLDKLDEFAFASRKLPEYMHWQLKECQCDLVYADPAPAPEELAKLYCDADFDSREEARFASRTYGGVLRKFLGRLPNLDGAVDVGTGDGIFLHELLEAGFRNVHGVEPSSAPIAAADPKVRPLIRHEIFQPNSFAAASLSLVTCFQTIEHLPDPLEFCREAWQTLKPGGILFLIGHNRRAFANRVMGRRSPIFDIEHLQLFSPRSMRRLLETAGFTSVEIQTVHNRYPARYWAQLFPFPQAIKPAILRFLDMTRLGRIVIPLPAGNIAAIATKSA